MTYAGLTTTDKGALLALKALEVQECTYKEIRLNIDLALAQIAEMESAEKASPPTPVTWNERINQMTVEEKAPLFQHNDCFIYKLMGTAYCDRHSECEECTKQFLRSPYTEGATK